MPKIKDLKFSETSKLKRTNFLDLISPNIINTITNARASKAITENTTASQNSQSILANDSESRAQEHNKGTLRAQQGYKDGTTRVQQEHNKGTLRVRAEHNKGTTKRAAKGTLRVQNEFRKAEKISPNEICGMGGIKEEILKHFASLCSTQGVLITPPVSTSNLSTVMKYPVNSIKKAIYRLKREGLLQTSESKRGKYSCYEIPASVKYYLLEKQKDCLITQGYNKGATKGTSKSTNAPVVSSSINITTTTENILSADFAGIDYSVLEEQGFSDSHLIQIFREYENNPGVQLPTAVIQDSINAMAFDLRHNNAEKSFKHPPVTVLISMLKKGKPYSSKTPERYISPQQEAMNRYMFAKDIQNKAQLDSEQKIKELEFAEWQTNLAEDELLGFTVENDFANFPEKIRKTMRRRKALELTKDYFDAEIWPKKREEILNLAKTTL